jgi:hypothetical protein
MRCRVGDGCVSERLNGPGKICSICNDAGCHARAYLSENVPFMPRGWRNRIAELTRERDEARAECVRYRERLQFDPGGSDKIDELEESSLHLRHRITELTQLLACERQERQDREAECADLCADMATARKCAKEDREALALSQDAIKGYCASEAKARLSAFEDAEKILLECGYSPTSDAVKRIRTKRGA